MINKMITIKTNWHIKKFSKKILMMKTFSLTRQELYEQWSTMVTLAKEYLTL
jgi:hypothetical protein